MGNCIIFRVLRSWGLVVGMYMRSLPGFHFLGELRAKGLKMPTEPWCRFKEFSEAHWLFPK